CKLIYAPTLLLTSEKSWSSKDNDKQHFEYSKRVFPRYQIVRRCRRTQMTIHRPLGFPPVSMSRLKKCLSGRTSVDSIAFHFKTMSNNGLTIAHCWNRVLGLGKEVYCLGGWKASATCGFKLLSTMSTTIADLWIAWRKDPNHNKQWYQKPAPLHVGHRRRQVP
ncbi:hypothetical protein DVH24_018860, partial [Malus domestica]